jgi:hypothetical protein
MTAVAKAILKKVRIRSGIDKYERYMLGTASLLGLVVYICSSTVKVAQAAHEQKATQTTAQAEYTKFTFERVTFRNVTISGRRKRGKVTIDDT